MILKLIENSGSGLTFSTSFWLYKIQLIMKRNTLKGIRGLILTRVWKKYSEKHSGCRYASDTITVTLQLLLSTNPAIHHKARGDIKLLNCQKKNLSFQKCPKYLLKTQPIINLHSTEKYNFQSYFLKAFTSIFTAVLNVEGEGLVTIHPSIRPIEIHFPNHSHSVEHLN